MSILRLLLSLFVLVGTLSHTDAAPMERKSYQESEIDVILKKAMFKSIDNFYTIKKAFQPQPGSHKLCILIAFNVTCSDQPDRKCNDTDTENDCTSGFNKTVLWTEYDTTDIAGKVLIYFASNDPINVPGFDWAGACDIPTSLDDLNDAIIPTINLIVPSLLCNDSSLESDIHQSQLYLTTLMPNYAKLSDIPSIQYADKMITGHGYSIDIDQDYYTSLVYAVTIPLCTLFLASFCIVFGISCPLFVIISESIETTKKGKPKLYYHFWSFVLLTIIGICYIVFSTVLLGPIYVMVFLFTAVMILCGELLTICNTVARNKQLFSAPLMEYCCGNRCRIAWSWFMTIVGFFFTLSIIVYLLLALPTILFVYYLYPTRTLIRVPFIIGALFYAIALISLVLYLFEKLNVMFFDKVCRLCCKARSYDDEEDDKDTPLQETRYHINGPNQWHKYNVQYYRKKYEEVTDNPLVMLLKCFLFIFQFFGGVLTLAAYIFAEFVVTKLVFKQTNVTDINSLLALLPTVTFSIFTWFGRGLIFDVREDIKELSISYFRKKDTVEEKILREITALKEELQQGIKIKQEAIETATDEVTGTVNGNGRAVDMTGISNDHDGDREIEIEMIESTIDDERQNLLTETPKLALATESAL